MKVFMEKTMLAQQTPIMLWGNSIIRIFGIGKKPMII